MKRERVDICVCTFRRPSVVETLASLASQNDHAGRSVRVIVADNDEVPSARDLVEAAAKAHGLDILYVHAPARNISIARNACLNAAEGDWIVFIDDDEVAPFDWLDRLMATRGERDVVFGRSQAVYDPATTPAWMIDADLHSNRIEGNDAGHNGYTCNVLMRRTLVEKHRLRFDLALGRSGGEDTMFFDQAHRAGARFGYAPDAVVFEEVPPHRATLGWLIRRRFRAGQIHREVTQRRDVPWVRQASLSAAKVAYCGLRSMADVTRPEGRARHLLRGALHLGVLSSMLGVGTYQEYASGPTPRG